MTKQVINLCKCCGTPYTYRVGGYDCFEPSNSATWCPPCAMLVHKALDNVPTRFAWIWVKSSDYTVPELLAIEKEKLQAEGVLMPRRVMPCLFNLDESAAKNENHTGYVKTTKGEYCYSYWDQGGSEEVQRRAYWDIKANKEKILPAGTR